MWRCFRSETYSVHERVNKSTIICIVMRKQKAPFSMLSRSKPPKSSKFKRTNIREKPVDFYLWYRTGVEIISGNNFSSSSSFAEVSVPVQSITPWITILNSTHENKLKCKI